MAEDTKSEIAFTPVDKMLELLCIVVLAGSWVFAIWSLSKLPAVIPMHFDGGGNADGYGDKATIFIAPAIGTIIYAGLTLLNKYPQLINSPVALTPATAIRVLRYLKTALVLLFAFILFYTYNAAV